MISARVGRLLGFTWLLVWLGPSGLAALLGFVAATWRGRLFAFTALAFVAAPMPWLWWLASRSRRALVLAGASSALTAGGLIALRLAVPTPMNAPTEVFARTPEGVDGWALTTLLPELDQLTLGSYLVAFVDPFLTHADAARVRALFLDVYRPMLAAPSFAALPSQLGEAYLDGASGQAFVFVPPHAPGERLPCVVFLHGSGGNFQGYLWVWSALARAGRFVVVAPGFGFGHWQRPGGVEAVEEARTWALETLPVDPSRMVLAGLSNGGRGVMRAIEADAERRWRAVILISAVVDVEPSEPAWRDRPVLVMHGLKDDRIEERWFRLALASLHDARATVTAKASPEADHFFVFSEQAQFSAWTLEFLRASAGFQ